MTRHWFLILVVLLLAPTLSAQEAETEEKKDDLGLGSPRAVYTVFIESFNHITQDAAVDPDATKAFNKAKNAGTLDQLDRASQCLDGETSTTEARFKRVYWLGRLLRLAGFSTKEHGSVFPEIVEKATYSHGIDGLEDGAFLFRRSSDGQWTIGANSEPQGYVTTLFEAGAQEATVASLRHYMPEVLLNRALFLEHWQWLGLVLLFALSWIVHRIVCFMSGRVLAGIVFKKTGLERTASAAASAKTSLGFFAAALVITALVHFLRLPPEANRIVIILAKILASVGGMLLAYRLADMFGARLEDAAQRTDSRLDDQLAPMAQRIVKVLITVGATLFVLDNLQVDIVSFLAGLGVVGIGVGLAAKDTFANLFGSITVLTDKPFTIGDWIKVGGVEGTVEEIGFRSTRVRTFYNSLISVPNSKLVDSTVDNMGARRYRRYKTVLGVTYNTAPDRIEEFCQGIEEIIRSSKEMRQDYFFIQLNDFGASSMNILVYVFFDVPDWGAELRARQQFILEILRLAEKIEVSFAFPSQSVYVETMPEG